MTMIAAEFVAAGRTLYGPRWGTALSRALGLSRAHVWRYATGRTRIPRTVELAMQTISTTEG